MKTTIQNNKRSTEQRYQNRNDVNSKNVTGGAKKHVAGKYALSAFLIILISAFSHPAILQAQVSVGVDVVNRYVWRGFDFGNSVNYQPSISYAKGGFEIGTWAAYSVDDAASNEHDLWIGYSFDLGNGSSIGIGATDYYFPAEPGGLFEYEGAGQGLAAHWIEPYVSYTGPESFPISLWAGIVATNDVEFDGDKDITDPDFDGDKATPVYIEASYPFSVGDNGVDMALTTGLITGESKNFYGVDQAAVTNINLSASKEIKLTDNFSLPLSASYIMNPFNEISYLVVGISL